MSIERLEDAVRYLEGLINVEGRLGEGIERDGLAAIRDLLAALGNPERGMSVVHVAGSKGKGSTALFCESLLRSLGERVGTFTSPHLCRWTERVRIDGQEVDGAAFARAVASVRPFVDEARRERPGRAPSFFDAVTAAALLLFAEAGLDRVVLEVGLGGRLDATNAVAAAVCCITHIELEHTDRLGHTLAAIAAEKAGILEAGVPAVVGALPKEALEVVRERARQVGAPLFEASRDFHIDVAPQADPWVGPRLDYREPGGFAVRAQIGALGAHQAVNAGLALAAIRRLDAHPEAALCQAAVRALFETVLPGRLERIAERPWILVDSAHTANSAEALAEVIAAVPATRVHLVLSVSDGKNLDAVVAPLIRVLSGAPGSTGSLGPRREGSEVTVTRADRHRSIEPREVAAAVRAVDRFVSVRVVPNPHLALRAARESLREDELLCVAGSVYLAGIARDVLCGDRSQDVLVSRRSGSVA